MTEPAPTDQRRFSRVPFLADALAGVSDELSPCHLLDIALKGALFDIPQPGEFVLGDETDQRIAMDGEVVHREGTHVGMKCLGIDIDSLANLRRLVEFNLGSDDFLGRELHELLKSHS
jgi:hypothetical protein